MNCRVVVEAAVPVYDVATADEAVRIAISKTGEMLNPDLNYVEINMGERSCPHCGEEYDPAFIAADESLVALELEMTVFNVERDEHAARIARKEIGQRLENIPLEVLEIEEIEDDTDEAEEDVDEAEEDVDEAEEDVDEAEEDVDEAEEDVDGAEEDIDGAKENADEAEEDADEAEEAEPSTVEEDSLEASTDTTDGGVEEAVAATADEDSSRHSGDDEVLPEFEELIDE